MQSLLLVALLSISTPGCGPKRVVVRGAEVSYEDGAAQVYAEGERARASGDAATARARYKEILDFFEDSSEVPAALFSLAELQYEEGGCAAARGHLDRLFGKYGTDARARRARERFAECVSGASAARASEDAQSGLLKQFEHASSVAERRRWAQAGIEASRAAEDDAEEARWRIRALEAEPDPAEKQRLEAELFAQLDGRTRARAIRELVEAKVGSEAVRAFLLYKLGLLLHHTRDLPGAVEALEGYLSSWPRGAHAADAHALLQRIAAQKRVKAKTLGVLLPLSGRHRSYGELGWQAIQLALGLDENNRGSDGLEVVVKDTRSEAIVAREMVDELVLEEGVIAILGPIFTYEAEAAAYRAQTFGVPLLTIAATDDITNIGSFIFRNGLTNRAQIAALVEHAMGVEGLRTFGVLYPRHPYGEELLGLFWEEVEKRKGEIRALEAYETTETTFQEEVRRLVGRDTQEGRGEHQRLLAECANQSDEYRKARCRENAGKSVRPRVDFEGLFIPDYPQKIAMVTAALAFEDIIVEKDPRRLRIIEKTLGRNVEPITLLGASGWNAPELVERAQRNVENAIFVDGFFSSSEEPGTAAFVEAYQKRFKRVPKLYPEALFYDSARILGAVLADKSPEGREALREALRQVSGFSGVTGKTSFLQSGDAEKPVKLLTIEDGRIRELNAAQPAE